MALIVSLLKLAAWSIGCFFSSWAFCGCLFLPQVLAALDVDPFLNNIHFPSTPAEFAAQSELFSRGGRNPLRGCVSAIDGIALRIRRPRVSEVPNPSSYWTRKGFFFYQCAGRGWRGLQGPLPVDGDRGLMPRQHRLLRERADRAAGERRWAASWVLGRGRRCVHCWQALAYALAGDQPPVGQGLVQLLSQLLAHFR